MFGTSSGGHRLLTVQWIMHAALYNSRFWLYFLVATINHILPSSSIYIRLPSTIFSMNKFLRSFLVQFIELGAAESTIKGRKRMKKIREEIAAKEATAGGYVSGTH